LNYGCPALEIRHSVVGKVDSLLDIFEKLDQIKNVEFGTDMEIRTHRIRIGRAGKEKDDGGYRV
jgi:hypothetical protein